ncbi:MAG: methanogenesis marker protein 11 [Candidatus Hydrothermarchaeota archaeon]
MKVYSREEFAEEFGDKEWIAPCDKIIAIASEDNTYVEIIEETASFGGSAWTTLHFKKTSKLVKEARREGKRNVFLTLAGKCDLNLVPGISGAGIEEIKIIENEIHVTYAGLGGGGVGASYSRGMAEGVKRVEIHASGGGSKYSRATVVLPRMERLVLGVDDTDNKEEGATWSLTHNLGCEIQKKGLGEYIYHSIVQLYPKNPDKTQNCVSVSLGFASKKEKKNEIIEFAQKYLEKNTLSDQTGLATYGRFFINEDLKKFSREAKESIVTIEKAYNVARKNDVNLFQITGKRGLIGALAAIPYYDKPDQGVLI